MHAVEKAKYIQDYKLLLTFEDNKQKLVDFRKVLDDFEGPVFRPLKDIEYFKRFQLGLDTVVWPNEADVCPDYLYDVGEEVS